MIDTLESEATSTIFLHVTMMLYASTWQCHSPGLLVLYEIRESLLDDPADDQRLDHAVGHIDAWLQETLRSGVYRIPSVNATKG